ncbi:hypothetical protein DRP77_03445, partial [Candidatus Poribacteria bacterium]
MRFKIAAMLGLALLALSACTKYEYDLEQFSHTTFDETMPSWSPDGTLLAYTTSEGEGDIVIAELKTLRVTKLTSGDAKDLAPCWSPDGRKIAFASDR